MPGGRLLPGESPVQGAMREFLEETGMEVSLIEEHPIEVQGGLVFIGLPGDKVGVPCDELVDVKWFTSLPKELSFSIDEYEMVFEKMKKILDERAVGAHQV